jgi:hypothetical protein
VPVNQLPSWLEEIGRIFPVYHVAAGGGRLIGSGSGDRAQGACRREEAAARGLATEHRRVRAVLTYLRAALRR